MKTSLLLPLRPLRPCGPLLFLHDYAHMNRHSERDEEAVLRPGEGSRFSQARPDRERRRQDRREHGGIHPDPLPGQLQRVRAADRAQGGGIRGSVPAHGRTAPSYADMGRRSPPTPSPLPTRRRRVGPPLPTRRRGQTPDGTSASPRQSLAPEVLPHRHRPCTTHVHGNDAVWMKLERRRHIDEDQGVPALCAALLGSLWDQAR